MNSHGECRSNGTRTRGSRCRGAICILLLRPTTSLVRHRPAIAHSPPPSVSVLAGGDRGDRLKLSERGASEERSQWCQKGESQHCAQMGSTDSTRVVTRCSRRLLWAHAPLAVRVRWITLQPPPSRALHAYNSRGADADSPALLLHCCQRGEAARRRTEADQRQRIEQIPSRSRGLSLSSSSIVGFRRLSFIADSGQCTVATRPRSIIDPRSLQIPPLLASHDLLQRWTTVQHSDTTPQSVAL